MLDQAMKMKMKEMILDELMEDLDNGEADKLKPKAALSITAIKPGEDSMSAEKQGVEMGMPQGCDEDDVSDEELKALLKEYMGK